MSLDTFFIGAFKKLTLPRFDRHPHRPQKLTPNFKRRASPRRASRSHVGTDNMGKSNKFDFSNRNNSGAKLGQIIGASLQKEAEKVKKDAAKQADKARKSSTGSSSGSGGSTDMFCNKHIIDLKAPNKNLGDEGVCALAEGLEDALEQGTAAASLALEDLNLSANSMTAASLPLLAKVVEQSKYDLKTLDLSGNNIKVESEEEAEQWATFLRSFARCMKLRRLDLSNNPELGPRAFEILARTHINEPQITSMPPEGEGSVLSLTSDHEREDGEGRKGQSQGPLSHDDDQSLKSDANMISGQVIKRRCGLRSIPFITLNGVGLTDAGAMWLSYVVHDHHHPSQLIDRLNATAAETAIGIYQQQTSSLGIDWTHNDTLGKEGSKLLDKAEHLRHQINMDTDASRASSFDLIEEDSTFGDADDSTDKKTPYRPSRAMPGDRRPSMRSVNTADGGEHEASELERARKKIQRHIVAHQGSQSVELWRSALQAFILSRTMLYLVPTKKNIYIGEPLFTTHNKDAAPSAKPSTPPSEATKTPPTTYKVSYAKTLSTSTDSLSDPSLAVADVTNTPTTPLRLQKPSHRKDPFGQGADLPAVTKKLNTMVVRDNSPERYIRHQRSRIERVEKMGGSFRDISMACQLPHDVVETILEMAMGRQGLKVMSAAQRKQVVEWGQNRATLSREREWSRKDRSAQVVMLLDSVECLSYKE